MGSYLGFLPNANFDIILMVISTQNYNNANMINYKLSDFNCSRIFMIWFDISLISFFLINSIIYYFCLYLTFIDIFVYKMGGKIFVVILFIIRHIIRYCKADKIT